MAAVGRSISNIAAAASRAATKLVNGESVACAVVRRGELAGDRLAKATIGPKATLDAAAMARMEKAGALVVHGDEGFAGLVTDRGVVTYLSHGTRQPKKQADPALLRARGRACLLGREAKAAWIGPGGGVCDSLRCLQRACAAHRKSQATPARSQAQLRPRISGATHVALADRNVVIAVVSV